jgi:PAS domain S-box-containing protein
MEAGSHGTDRQRRRQASEEREALARDAARLARVGGWSYDVRTGRATWSGETYEILGFPTTDEAPDDVALRLYEPTDRERIVADIQRCQDTGEAFDGEYRIVSWTGTPMRVRVVGTPELDDAGQVVRVVGAFQDVTELRRTEAAVEQLAAMVEQASDAIHVRSLDHTILFWNRRATEVLGWERGEAVGASARDLLFTVEQQPRFDAAHKALLETGTWEGEFVQRTRWPDRTRTVEARWTLVRRPGDLPVVLSICTDVTGQREREARELRDQRLESLGTLAGGIAHDLNNVLTPITISAGLLLERITDPQDRELLEIMAAGSRRGAEMIRGLLEFARGADGERTVVEVADLLHDLARLVRETFPPSIHLEVDVAADLPPVLANRTELHQVLLNLAVNSRDAMAGEEGSLVLRGRRGAHDDTVVLEVADDGPGMPPAVLQRVFEPFFTTKEVGSGTGLGLSTSIGIIERHGGTIDVHSEPGRGTTVAVTLPTAPRETSAPAEAPEQAGAAGEGATVLVVDDEEAVRFVVERTLTRAGYQVVTASNGAEALDVLEARDDVAVILLDMMMPVLDGRRTVPRLRETHPDVHVVMTSGVLGAPGVDAPPQGVSSVLPKPFTRSELLASIERLVQP